MGNKKVFVGGLSWNTDEDTIRSLFEEIGRVKDVKLIHDRDTGKSRGFAFITFESVDSVQKAINELNDTMLDGRSLRVTIAEDRRNKA